MELESFSIHAISRRRPLPPVTSCDGPSNGLEKESELPKRAPQKLKRTLNLLDLIFYGVGCSVGAGIYSLVGIGAKLAGPSIALSFLLCGTACCFTSLAYAEFAARVPLAGSAYTFTYVSFGELCGWLVGWNLTLGYAVSAAVVARSWAEYLVGFLQGLAFFDHVELAPWLTRLPIGAFEDYTCCPLSMLIIGFCTVVLVTGVKESTRFNTAMTILNLLVLGLVLLAGVGTGAVNADNLQPIFPNGMDGMARGAGLVFFAYLGFDMVACLSEEVQNPKRNMPIGIIGSLMVSMSIYVAVSVVVVGMAPVALLGEGVPIINALLANACCSHAEQLLEGATETCLSYTCSPVLHQVLYSGSRLISFGAIFGLTTATFACLMGQPRIFYSMAQDGLLFKIYARVSPTTGVPTVGTIITGIFTALVACLFDLESLANAISLGTLQVFTVSLLRLLCTTLFGLVVLTA
jgi:APA family basic amino acid/polyamine antiporter